MIWYIRGTQEQRDLVHAALRACDFPFDRLAPSLRKENRRQINVSFQDLSERDQLEAAGHSHVHDRDYDAHPIVRPIGGRSRVLGLYYLPPHTAVVLDASLTEHPLLCQEVFLAEAAHAVDYHYMTNDMRREFWNAVHPDHQDLDMGTDVPETGDIDHDHSWFDGASGYDTWVGEAWMQGFVTTFAPGVPYTMPLGHEVPTEAVPRLRRALLGEAEPAEPQSADPLHGWWGLMCRLWRRLKRWLSGL